MFRKVFVGFLIFFLAVSTDAHASNWYPSDYVVSTDLNTDVAYKNVSSKQAGHCTWCSIRHGLNYWKIDFIAKHSCSNFYMNANLFSKINQFEGSWYQKGYYQPAMHSFRLEIVTKDPTSHYKITQIIC